MSKRNSKRLPKIPNVNAGKICEILVENFLTYKKFKFNAEPYLNLIIGPNGTGKSSIVSAIVLVFGGEPKLLGRNNDLSTYVRSGSSAAYVCVKINGKNNNEYVKFQRNFNIECVSEYRINDTLVTKAAYLKEVNSFNIQISNLCQFLPQDRVQEFARMSSHDMLLNTLKSVCSEQVSLDLTTLITLRKQQVNGVKDITSWKKKLLESENRLNDLKAIINSYKLRNNICDKIGLCNLKIVNLEKSVKETEIKSYKKDLNEATKVLNKYTALVKSMMSKKNKIKNQTEQLSAEVQKANLEEQKFDEEIEMCFQQIDEANNNITRAKYDYKQKVEGIQQKQKQLQKAKDLYKMNCTDYKRMEAEIETLDSSMAAICSKKEKLESTLKSLVQERSVISKEIEEDLIPMKQQIQHTMNNYKDKIKKYEEFFRTNYPDVLKANNWIKQNKNLFKGNVFSPILMEINISDPNNVKYFENIIPIRDLCAFTVEDIDDFSLLVNDLNTKLNLKINLCFSEPATKCHYTPNVSLLQLKPYGFHSYMVDLVKGPPSIINHLCSLFSIHNIPVGNADVHKYTASIPVNIHTFFGENSRYSVKISKYSKQPSTVKNTIAGKNIISSQNPKEINDINQK
ncbi:structural maintenance of chromosomes protein 5-like [Teleopsis dalmanni]|uniref:structural maintenance of chromosomes protein 5-like n=1 Tax=Teleopsis dalmanni TaxID=139649 RepID=UPI0018CE89E9|nr:structural maintenance of chromosomes protein 5-like [Teleopsis dalmanni]